MKKDVKEASSEDEEKMEDSPVMGLLTEHKKTKVQTKKSQVVEKKKIPTESTIKEAVKKRASYLKANSEYVILFEMLPMNSYNCKLLVIICFCCCSKALHYVTHRLFNYLLASVFMV